MALHPPKLISSNQGLGANTKKNMKHLTASIAIGTEIWNKLDEPWRQGDTVIAEPGYVWMTKWETGKPYIISKFYDTDRELVGVYCDVTRPVRRVGEGFEFDDLYLDVWQVPGQNPVILDEDELVDAVKAGYILADEAKEAREIAEFLIQKLKSEDFLKFSLRG